MTKIYQAIASSFDAMSRARDEWVQRHENRILTIVKEHMPSGSGFDSGTQFDFDKSQTQRLIFNTMFHHMNENGYYDGWTEHSVIVTPCLVHGFAIKITGKNRNDIKEYIGDMFNHVLNEESTI